MRPVAPALYPFTSHFFDRSGLRLHYLDEGQGPVLVLLHGTPTWSFHFRAVVLALRGRYRIIVPDHMGMGLSDRPGDDRYGYRLANRIDDLDALLAHLGIDRDVTLVMHDWGGMIGMGWAARRPQAIARMVLLNTAAFHMPPGARVPIALRLLRGTALGNLLIRRTSAFVRIAARRCVCRPLPPAVRAAYLAPYDSPAARLALQRFLEDVPVEPDHPSHALVGEIEASLPRFKATPTLLCWGERDVVLPPSVLRAWRGHWPQAEVRTFAHCGHYLIEDAPDEVCAAIAGFLRRTDGPGAVTAA